MKAIDLIRRSGTSVVGQRAIATAMGNHASNTTILQRKISFLFFRRELGGSFPKTRSRAGGVKAPAIQEGQLVPCALILYQ